MFEASDPSPPPSEWQATGEAKRSVWLVYGRSRSRDARTFDYGGSGNVFVFHRVNAFRYRINWPQIVELGTVSGIKDANLEYDFRLLTIDRYQRGARVAVTQVKFSHIDQSRTRIAGYLGDCKVFHGRAAPQIVWGSRMNGATLLAALLAPTLAAPPPNLTPWSYYCWEIDPNSPSADLQDRHPGRARERPFMADDLEGLASQSGTLQGRCQG